MSEVVPPPEDRSEDQSTSWQHNDTLLLIETYRNMRGNFRDSTKKKREVWDGIAQKMNEVDQSNKFTGSSCNKKWNNLELRYKAIRDKSKKTGRGGGKKWVYYDLLDELIGSTAAVTSITEATMDDSDDQSTEQAASSGITATTATPNPLKRKRDQPPAWFEAFASKWTEDSQARHEEIKDLLQSRTEVMKDMRDILKSWVDKQGSG